MKEGLWINALTGDWRWITEHASWIQVPANAMSLGMAEDAALRLSAMPWDFNGPGRMAILLAAMPHGFVRVRGHGATCTFEHTMSQAQAIEAARGFMAANFGPQMTCRFSALHTMEVMEVLYEDLLRCRPNRGDQGQPCSSIPTAISLWHQGGTRGRKRPLHSRLISNTKRP